MTADPRQAEVQALSEPMIEETVARLRNAGIEPHEIAQALVLTGVGLLVGSLGPKQAGHTLREVSTSVGQWVAQLADHVERGG